MIRSDTKTKYCLVNMPFKILLLAAYFKIYRSQGVACSICLDVVKERSSPDNRMFGLLGSLIYH